MLHRDRFAGAYLIAKSLKTLLKTHKTSAHPKRHCRFKSVSNSRYLGGDDESVKRRIPALVQN